ncbi:hypothetical protein HBI78_100760 [Parastagonospora nodorum]|nr:hypothetical protein HBI78_100760 [Parastagonospora nodorum]
MSATAGPTTVAEFCQLPAASCHLPSAFCHWRQRNDARTWENEFPSAASGMSQLQQCDASAHPHPTRTGAAHDVLGPGVLEASPQSAAKAATLDTSQLAAALKPMQTATTVPDFL